MLRFSSTTCVLFYILSRYRALKTTQVRPKCTSRSEVCFPLAPDAPAETASPRRPLTWRPEMKVVDGIIGVSSAPGESRCAQRHLRNAIRAPARSRGTSPEPRSPAPSAGPSKPAQTACRSGSLRSAPAYGVAKGPPPLSRHLRSPATPRGRLAPTRPRGAQPAPLSRRCVLPNPRRGARGRFL